MNRSTIKIDDLPDVLTVRDVQNCLGIGRNMAYDLIKENTFRSVQIGKKITVPKKEFLKWYLGE